MDEVSKTVRRAVKELFDIDIKPELSRPEERYGDFATNIALQLAGQLDKPPREIAEALTEKINSYGYYQKVQVAGPGFLNITLKDSDIWNMAKNAINLPTPLARQEILVEFGDPNPFKEMHIGHLYSYIVGDSISRLLEASGATVRRLSYHGDVGLHVARAIWAAQKIGGFGQDNTAIGQRYAEGALAYEKDENAKAEIDSINKRIYKKDDDQINELYEQGRSRSFEYFKNVLREFDVKNDKQYLESQSSPVGVDFVLSNTPKVFTKSDGAIVYKGEKVGLHTRVFITSKGLPTYEAKDLGLTELKNKDYPDAVRSIIITANEQSEYFKVMLAALAEFDKKLADKTTHLSHGFVSLSIGKMSSRTGEVYSAASLMVDVEQAAKQKFPDANKVVLLAAIKYGFLKHRLGSDLTYDVNESVSLEGNSGPYLQYAQARARAILQKAQPGAVNELESDERSLARKVSEYPEVVAKATAELMPHIVATYLYELAQSFNRFYENNRVAGAARQATRAALVAAYADTLKSGLSLLNIEAPDRV